MGPGPAATIPGAEDADEGEHGVAAEPTRAAKGEGVAIVVLNRNGRDLLLACLEAVAGPGQPGLQVVVVDNGSDDASAEAVAERFPAVHLLRQTENRGVAGGRNAGVRWVLGRLAVEYLVFIDNDTLVGPGAVAELVAAAAVEPWADLVAPKAFRRQHDRRLLSAGGLTFNPYTGVLRDAASGEIDRGQHDRPRDIQVCPGFAFLARPRVFERIGLFDETFNPYGWEDVDFSLRAARAGFRLVYAPRAVVYHAGGRAGRGPVALYERHKARRMLYFLRHHTTTLQLCSALLLLTVRSVWRIALELGAGNGRVVQAWLEGALGRGPRTGDRVGWP
jgi:GT2 family glycosyltransferase